MAPASAGARCSRVSGSSTTWRISRCPSTYSPSPSCVFGRLPPSGQCRKYGPARRRRRLRCHFELTTLGGRMDTQVATLTSGFDFRYGVYLLVFCTMYTHTHTRLTALCQGLPGWAGTRKVKPNWILLKQETVSSIGIRWAICKSAPRSRQITTPLPHRSVFLQAGCPSCRPTNSVKALKAFLYYVYIG